MQINVSVGLPNIESLPHILLMQTLLMYYACAPLKSGSRGMMATSNTGRGAVLCTYEYLLQDPEQFSAAIGQLKYGGVRRNAAGKNEGWRVVRMQPGRTRLHLLTASLCRLDYAHILQGLQVHPSMYHSRTSLLSPFMLVF